MMPNRPVEILVQRIDFKSGDFLDNQISSYKETSKVSPESTSYTILKNAMQSNI